MPHFTELTRLQLELRDDTWIALGRTAIAWGTVCAAAAVVPALGSSAVDAECACPADCIRDHETD